MYVLMNDVSLLLWYHGGDKAPVERVVVEGNILRAHKPASHMAELMTACTLPSFPISKAWMTVQGLQHLHVILSIAPDRFLEWFLERQDDVTSDCLSLSVAFTTGPLLAEQKKNVKS